MLMQRLLTTEFQFVKAPVGKKTRKQEIRIAESRKNKTDTGQNTTCRKWQNRVFSFLLPCTEREGTGYPARVTCADVYCFSRPILIQCIHLKKGQP